VKSAIELAESGLLPDSVIRLGIRRMLARRLEEEERQAAERARWRAELAAGPVTLHPEAANAQHYELPAAFFERVLGPRLKYSTCLWSEGVRGLAEAEQAMLDLTFERAEVRDGERILELGCGWGSLCLHLAERFPRARITALSNSASQRAFIEARAAERGLANLEVATADVGLFDTEARFERVVSVEMFEHVRNHRELVRRIGRWLVPEGTLFVHLFAHRRFAYPFEDEGPATWMARHFFTGGIMPSLDLLPEAARGILELDGQWTVDGTHYQKTLEAWLSRQDAARGELLPLFAEIYGAKAARLGFRRWRIFFMACAELFGFRGGSEWLVAHYRFRAPASSRGRVAGAAPARHGSAEAPWRSAPAMLSADPLVCFAHAAYRLGDRARARGLPLRFLEVRDRAALETAIGEVEVLVISGLWRDDLLEKAPRLAFVQSISAGTDQYGKEALRARGVRLASAAGVNAAAVAEHAMALLLALSRKLPEAVRNQDRRHWRGMIGDLGLREQELGGKTMVLVGLGRIGGRIAALARAFGMRVLAVRRDPAAGREGADAVYGLDALDRLLAEAEVLLLACPLTPETENLVDARRLALLPPGALFVNVARGRCVEEAALLEALGSGRLAGAAIDVTREEPLPENSPLWSAPNLLITPHSAGETRAYEDRVLDLLVENLARLRRGESRLVNEVV